MKHLKGDHDEHVQTWDEQKWKDWPPSEPAPAEAKVALNSALEAGTVTIEVTTVLYVQACSLLPENLYWTERGGFVPLADATAYTREEMLRLGETPDGFWMTLDRAMELEK
jgi:hypothetical protein